VIHPLYKVIGLGRAKEVALSGAAIDANEAYRIALVNRVYPAQSLGDETTRVVELLASRPREALLETKRLTRDVIDLNMESAMSRMFQAISERLKSDAHARAIHDYVGRLTRS
jgi:enoyl-CoA hydratase